jgi:hypothetical protein
MTRIIVLVNLKPGKSRAEYEAWAAGTDLPTVNALASVDRFELYESTGLFGGGTPPYDYIEIIDVNDMDAFGRDTSTAEMTRIAAQFQDWAEPVFILTRRVAAP